MSDQVDAETRLWLYDIVTESVIEAAGWEPGGLTLTAHNEALRAVRNVGIELRDVLCRYLGTARPQDMYRETVDAYNAFCRALAAAVVDTGEAQNG